MDKQQGRDKKEQQHYVPIGLYPHEIPHEAAYNRLQVIFFCWHGEVRSAQQAVAFANKGVRANYLHGGLETVLDEADARDMKEGPEAKKAYLDEIVDQLSESPIVVNMLDEIEIHTNKKLKEFLALLQAKITQKTGEYVQIPVEGFKRLGELLFSTRE
ncbi:hypothetical protein C5B42_06070 [Candidatus Cerribacteria bacterium 'Amazon FNV 2010 28 9']|uniref:Rhodanese domain-containing protein n=1 Tax=Candidatus Cerribacteria bacterium 'Amazon FNV 2010 28 9' TaxID=2081795 RepID=A0A317JMA3_9BACT|nr:MAG: hypothetical protein C5B42_06070 [Candidatus Cerribacteria bacterium 'Amazon FNV 2010 28 9']